MKELIAGLQSSLQFSDAIDVTIVAVIVYRLLLLIRGTRAMQMLTGLGILGIGFFVSSHFELFTTHWLMSHFFDYLVLMVIVLFQDDLRRALANVGKNPFFSSAHLEEGREMVEEIARSASRMAKERLGGLIVIEKETGLKNFIDTGSKVDSKVKSELIYSIFQHSSPIHDGAIIISEGRIAGAGCFLPLTKETTLEKHYGTRHRAAMGLTEETDAIVVLVSEESGSMFLVRMGRLTSPLTEFELKQSLNALLEFSAPTRGLIRRLTQMKFLIKRRHRRGSP